MAAIMLLHSLLVCRSAPGLGIQRATCVMAPSRLQRDPARIFNAAGPRPAHNRGIIVDRTGRGNETTDARIVPTPDRAQLWIGPTPNSTFDRDLPRVEPDFAIFVWCKSPKDPKDFSRVRQPSR